jgi:large subunit ribosomal protein L18
MRPEKKNELAQKKRWRVRKKVIGTAERPRMSVKFSGQHVYVQFIDDGLGRTLAAVSTRDKNANIPVKGANVAAAIEVGKKAASAAQQAKIETVVFDRGTARYHGKVKALADAAREAGLKF